MIIDCHTHVWDSPDQLGMAKAAYEARSSRAAASGMGSGIALLPDASTARHYAASDPVDRSFVLGFKSRYLGAEVPLSLISRYVREHPEKLIGAVGIDPTNLSEAMDDLASAHQQFGLKAVTVSPAAQDFHPADSRAMQVFAEAARLRMPVLFHQGVHFSSAGKMEFARPSLIDEVARDLPQLRIVIAHMGYPWVEETIVLLGKHPNIFSDISGLLHRSWHAYNALLSAHQYGVIDKLLFGSDFPFASAKNAIESLYRINQLVTGTNMPTVPRSSLAAIVERDALGLLGIENAVPTTARDPENGLLDPHDA